MGSTKEEIFLADSIKKMAFDLGFGACGIARAESLEAFRGPYEDYLQSGKTADLFYLAKYKEPRLNPELLLPGVRSVIAVAMNYYTGEPADQPYIIARYARGKSYHTLMKQRLRALCDGIREMGKTSNTNQEPATRNGEDTTRSRNQENPGNDPIKTRFFMDSGPVLEKRWAQRCGIGWQGKNTILINPDLGSFVFLGIIFTTLDLPADNPEEDRCGSCRKCVDACPTNALGTPYQLDISRCISYHTIEQRDGIPEEIRSKLNNRIYGCDICQDVCPYNQNLSPTTESWFNSPPVWLSWLREDWENLTEETFHEVFAESDINRKGHELMMESIRICRDQEEPPLPSSPH